jgi:hypothetical protein
MSQPYSNRSSHDDDLACSVPLCKQAAETYADLRCRAHRLEAEPIKATTIAAEKAAKPRVDVVPPALMLAAGRGFGLGVAKHGLPEGNDGFGTWRTPGHPQADPLAAYGSLMRHLLAWRNGETIDPESGDHKVAHLDAAAAQLAKLVDLVERGTVAAPVPVEPTPHPWALPKGLSWWYDCDGWNIDGIAGSLWIGGLGPHGSLLVRPDAPALIDLLRRRNAAEPDGPKAGAR